jgi:hypothetical protein
MINNKSDLITYKQINTFIRCEIKIKSYNIASYNYWLIRGWTLEEINKKRLKLNVKHSPMQIENWLNKINSKTNLKFTKAEAEYKIKSFKKINIEYWIEKGFNDDTAKQQVSLFQSEMSNKFIKKIKDNPEKYDSIKNSQLKYWLKKGYSLEDALEKRKDSQDTYSLKKIIKKYGEEIGKEIYKTRCEKTGEKNTLKYHIEKYGEEIGKEKYLQKYTNTRLHRSSKQAYRFFIPLYKFLRKNGFNKEDIFWAIGKSKEYFLNKENKIYFYDFTIPKLNIIFEYHGIKFHPNPSWDKNKWDNWKTIYSDITVEEAYKKDKNKKQCALNENFDYIEVYSDEDLKTKRISFIKILQEKLIKQNGKKDD